MNISQRSGHMRKQLVIAIVLSACLLFVLPVFAAPIQPNSAIPEPPVIRLQVPFGGITEMSRGGEGIASYLATLYQWLVRIAVVLSVLMFTIAGFVWITAGGESGQIKKAHEIIKNTIIGLALALGSYAILYNTNPALVQPLDLDLATIQRKEIEIEEMPITKSCEEICKKTAESKGSSWTSMSGTIEACTPGEEKKVNQTVEVCVKDDPMICKCVLLTQTAGATNCRTLGCGTPYFCDLPSNTCKDRLAEDQPCDLTISNHCADGLICKDVSGQKKCSKDAAAADQGTCCYHTYVTNGTSTSYGNVDIPVAEGPAAMSYAECMGKGPTRASGTNKAWWFCKNTIPAATACGTRQSGGSFPPIQIPDGNGGFKAGTSTQWTPHSVSPAGNCTLFRYGSNPTVF